jgi:hypothetical protein
MSYIKVYLRHLLIYYNIRTINEFNTRFQSHITSKIIIMHHIKIWPVLNNRIKYTFLQNPIVYLFTISLSIIVHCEVKTYVWINYLIKMLIVCYCMIFLVLFKNWQQLLLLRILAIVRFINYIFYILKKNSLGVIRFKHKLFH